MASILRHLDRLLLGGLLLAAIAIVAGFHAGARPGEKEGLPVKATEASGTGSQALPMLCQDSRGMEGNPGVEDRTTPPDCQTPSGERAIGRFQAEVGRPPAP